MLNVSKLVKRYGDILAVSDISFSVSEGEIYGLLDRTARNPPSSTSLPD